MDKYLQYDPAELAEDKSFKDWVQAENADKKWSEWVLLHPEKLEDINLAKAIVLGLKFKEVPIPRHTENEIWSRINTSIMEKNETNKTNVLPLNSIQPKILKWVITGAAAAIALFFLVNNVFLNQYDTKVISGIAQTEIVNLPDGSFVSVNANSTLQYNKKDWTKDRFIELDGEAFFEVEKGSSFTVKTKNGTVEVLGTSFNVYSRAENFNVQCETGKVKVDAKGNISILTPGKKVFITNNKHQLQEFDVTLDKRSNWRNGIYYYNEVALEEVVDELERQLSVEIMLNNDLKNVKYTGSFDKNNGDKALTEVFWPLNLKFNKEGRKVTITKE